MLQCVVGFGIIARLPLEPAPTGACFGYSKRLPRRPLTGARHRRRTSEAVPLHTPAVPQAAPLLPAFDAAMPALARPHSAAQPAREYPMR